MSVELDQIASWLRAARSVVAFTGAGISTESGIPDFRSPGGIWSQSTPVLYQDFVAYEESRYEYWRQKAIFQREFESCQPNAGHQTLARWEQAGRLRLVITQNIDGLHQAAGSQRVIELHGTARQVACLRCAYRDLAQPWVERFLQTDQVPRCPECGGPLKHATISFGQALDRELLAESYQVAQMADLFLAIGSSLVVEPAASLPRYAQEQGARLVIINRTPTPCDPLADIVLSAGIGETLAAIDERL
ncbi:MAG: SIR2 family NAD-dependent protein deacylase [Planctomycetota bacterium]